MQKDDPFNPSFPRHSPCSLHRKNTAVGPVSDSLEIMSLAGAERPLHLRYTFFYSTLCSIGYK